MQRSKQLALMFLLGAFLAGGALGFSADRLLVRDRLCPENGRKRAHGRFAAELNLTPEQRVAIDSIVDAKNRQLRAIIDPVRPQLDAASDSARAHIRLILTPEQRAKFDELRRESRRKIRLHRDRGTERDSARSGTRPGAAEEKAGEGRAEPGSPIPPGLPA